MFFYPSLICASMKKIRLKLYLKASKSRIVLVFDARSSFHILTTEE